MRNRSDKVVTAFEFVLYVYTPAGKPVKYPNGAYGALVEFTFALQPGQLDDKSYIAVPYTTTQMQRIGLFAPFFKSVTFADGSSVGKNRNSNRCAIAFTATISRPTTRILFRACPMR